MRKPRTRKAMIEYLSEHFRYSTMNSWNGSTSYAVCVKAHRLGLPKEQEDACFEMLDIEGIWDECGYNTVLEDFAERHGYVWQIGTNGRNGGYLVLYQGYRKVSEHKSYCRFCGQRNFTLATKDDCRCGRCGKEGRINATMYEKGCYPGKDVDQGEDFALFSTYDLKARTELVWDFDQTCAAAVETFVAYAMEHKAVKKVIMVPKEIIVTEERT